MKNRRPCESCEDREYSETVRAYYSSKADCYHEDSGYGSACSNCDSELINYLQEAFAGRQVLEIACGTGYWTRQVSEAAGEITGTDASREMLVEAERLNSDLFNTAFIASDAFSLVDVPVVYTGAFSVLWWCHMPLGRIQEFLDALHSKLLPGARIVHVCQLHDIDHKEHQRDSQGNMLADRTMEDRTVKIVKNIPDELFLMNLLKNCSSSIEYYKSDSWWWRVSYTLC